MNHIRKTHLLRLFDGGMDITPPIWQPSLDIYRTSKGWLLKFELAGVDLDDLRLEILDNTVRLSGARRDLCCGESYLHQTMEIAYTRFERSIELPESLAGSTVRTEVVNGMLLVTIEVSNHERQNER